MKEVKVGTKKWYQNIVKERKHWIKFSKENIAHFEEMLKGEKEHLEKCEQWLAEAEKNLSDFIAKQ